MRFLTCSRKGGGDVKIKKAFLTKCSNLVFSVMAVVAMIFANCQCSGRAYEPKLPEELKIECCHKRRKSIYSKRHKILQLRK